MSRGRKFPRGSCGNLKREFIKANINRKQLIHSASWRKLPNENEMIKRAASVNTQSKVGNCRSFLKRDKQDVTEIITRSLTALNIHISSKLSCEKTRCQLRNLRNCSLLLQLGCAHWVKTLSTDIPYKCEGPDQRFFLIKLKICLYFSVLF